MSNIKYNGEIINSTVSDIDLVGNNFSLLSNDMKKATNKIISARGFSEYIGGLSSDSFSSAIDECKNTVSELVKTIRQQQIMILAYSNDGDEIKSFLASLSRKDFNSLDFEPLKKYLTVDVQAGKILSSTGATIATFGVSLVEGVLDFAETAADLIVMAGTGVASIFTGLYDFFTGSDITKKMWEGTKTWVSDKKVENIFNSFYANTSVGRWMKDNAYGYDTVRSVGKGVGYTAGVVAVTVLTCGAGGAAVGATTTATAAASGGTVISAVGGVSAGQLAVTAGVMGISSGSEDAWADGATLEDGLKYGFANGIWEGTQWYAGGTIAKMGGGSLTDIGKRVTFDTIDSAVEGFVQPGMTTIYKDYGGSNFSENYQKAFESSGGWKNVVTQAAIGAVASTAGETGAIKKAIKEKNFSNKMLIAGGGSATLGVGAADNVFKKSDATLKTLDSESNVVKNIASTSSSPSTKKTSMSVSSDAKVDTSPGKVSQLSSDSDRFANKKIEFDSAKNNLDLNDASRIFTSDEKLLANGGDGVQYNKMVEKQGQYRNAAQNQFDGSFLKKANDFSEPKTKIIQFDDADNGISLFKSNLENTGQINLNQKQTLNSLDNASEYIFKSSNDKKMNFLNRDAISSVYDTSKISDAKKIANSINERIKNEKHVVYEVKSTKELSSVIFENIDDLSNLEVKIYGGFSDLDGNIKTKYMSDRYQQRITYTGYEALGIMKKIEGLEKKIDMNLPTVERARQIYDIVANEYSYSYDSLKLLGGHQVSASLRGITPNNVMGHEGLVCAGYSQLYKELCDRSGIQCEYIRGKGITSSGGKVTHAWNVVLGPNGEEIPVDVTWHSANKGNWFGASNLFASTHIADANEKFTNYLPKSTPSKSLVNNQDAVPSRPLVNNQDAVPLRPLVNNQDAVPLRPLVKSDESILHVVSVIDSKEGVGAGNYRLVNYLATDRESVITRTDGSRQIISSLSRNDIANYVKNSPNKTVTVMNYIKNELIDKYGYDDGTTMFNNFLSTANYNYVTRENGARNIAKEFLSDDDIYSYWRNYG